MDDRVIKSLKGWRMTIGGDEHQGWIPRGAAEPLPDPVLEVTFNLEIVFAEEGSWLLVFDSDHPDYHGDTWHPSLAEALSQALEVFGVEPSQWDNAC